MRVAGLFAGIGGIELGLHAAGHSAAILCELDPAARAVLRARFPDTPLHDDVRTLTRLPGGVDVLAGGFPCQDLSQAGRTRGIGGERSGLVHEIFRLLRTHDVPHVLLENVSFMRSLGRGHAMRVLVGELERLGYRWAYRVIDTRAFGLPQRRQRLYLLASRTLDPASLLLTDEALAPGETDPGPPGGTPPPPPRSTAKPPLTRPKMAPSTFSCSLKARSSLFQLSSRRAFSRERTASPLLFSNRST